MKGGGGEVGGRRGGGKGQRERKNEDLEQIPAQHGA